MDYIMKTVIVYCIILFFSVTNLLAEKSSLLFYGNCTACHMDNAKKSAPKFSEIKENYLRAYPIKADFVQAMSGWVYNPKEETSLMQPAIKEYNLMPHLAYDLKVLEEIASYIYETEFNN